MTHFMLKEIHEQPDVIRHLLDRPISISFENVDRINILACGTSLHAGLIGQFLFEQVAKIPTQIRSSSEALFAPLIETANTVTIALTQSGETADTISALQIVQSKRIAITNGIDSTITSKLITQFIQMQEKKGALLQQKHSQRSW
ncbi:SIS domain-containing protein [Cyanobacteria bacterium FACHB-63]|nr:SIS domain-containing protein [Cyanobacteria bacterium FACHB-63]